MRKKIRSSYFTDTVNHIVVQKTKQCVTHTNNNILVQEIKSSDQDEQKINQFNVILKS